MLTLVVWFIPIAIGILAIGLIARKKSGAVASAPAKVLDQTSLRQTPHGAIVGFADKNQTHAWLGIPYAQAPVGALRWKAPRPPEPWRDVKKALEYGPIAM